MIKLTFCLHRLPHLGREALQACWRETHAACGEAWEVIHT